MRGTNQWLEGNESSLDTMSVKMDLMYETPDIFMEEHNRIKGLMNSWKTRQNDKRLDSPPSEDHVTYQQSPQRKTRGQRTGRVCKYRTHAGNMRNILQAS